MAGMKLAKDSLPIDYCHFPDEVLGYLNKFETTTGDLVASGALVPFSDEDRASEVSFKAKQGVPYEASINFAGGPMRLEEIEAGISVNVNGNTVHGPALIIREWTLRGIAVCPYGADMNTKTELSAKGAEQLSGTVEVTLFKAGNMPNTNEPNKTGDKPDELKQAPTDPKPGEPGKELKQGEQPAGDQKPQEAKPGTEFVTAFGDVGARWYLDGRKFSECAAEFITGKDKKIAELQAEVAQLKQTLADIPGGNEAVSFKAGDDKKEKLPKGVNGAAAAFARAREQQPAQ